MQLHQKFIYLSLLASPPSICRSATLLFLINSINDDDLAFPGKDAGPLFVGGTVALLIVATGTISGCGMNPARDFGPRLITALASGPKVATA